MSTLKGSVAIFVQIKHRERNIHLTYLQSSILTCGGGCRRARLEAGQGCGRPSTRTSTPWCCKSASGNRATPWAAVAAPSANWKRRGCGWSAPSLLPTAGSCSRRRSSAGAARGWRARRRSSPRIDGALGRALENGELSFHCYAASKSQLSTGCTIGLL